MGVGMVVSTAGWLTAGYNERMVRLAIAVGIAVVLAACPGGRATQVPVLTASGPRLATPTPIDPGVRGAAYLMALARTIQPGWAQFLEDCRLRLPKNHPLNDPSLEATADLAIGLDGRLVARIARGSGNGDFDTAVFDLLGDASPAPPPPADLLADDDAVHVRWLFARDRRQAGSATAAIVDVRLPLLKVIDRRIAAGDLPRAIGRIASARPTDADRLEATRRVMVATLRDVLHGGDGTGIAIAPGSTRSPIGADGVAMRAAISAAARVGTAELGRDVWPLARPFVDRDLRLAALAALADAPSLRRDGSGTAVPAFGALADQLVTALPRDLLDHPTAGLAELRVLATLEGPASVRTRAIAALRGALAERPSATAIAALGVFPDPTLAPKLRGFLASRDVAIRAAACAALPEAAVKASPVATKGAVEPARSLAIALVARGLRDRDASVRAACLEAARRDATRAKDRAFGIAASAAIQRQIAGLARDRDSDTRAAALAALGTIDPTSPARAPAVGDPSSTVRRAAVIGASETDLRTLAADAEPDVRAAAIRALGDRAPDLASHAVGDPSAIVRQAAISIVTDPSRLEQLAHDTAPEVATAAAIRLAALRGRKAITAAALAELARGGSATARVRIALAWLLAR